MSVVTMDKVEYEPNEKRKYTSDQDTKLTMASSNLSEQIPVNSSKDNQFEIYYKQYYVDSSKNSSINFDTYLHSGLKLISLFPENANISFTNQIKQKLTKLPERPNHKKTLILDMDETLIHADVDFNFKFHDEILKFTCEDEEILIPLILRPHLFEFLNFAYEHFELVIFTASEPSYADAILDYIEKDKKYFAKRLYRDSCLYLNPGLYIKDLNIFQNRNQKDIVIVDNSVFCFSNQLNNGILISSFFNDQNDSMLMNLVNYLNILANADDIREENKKYFQFQTYLEEIKKGNEFRI